MILFDISVRKSAYGRFLLPNAIIHAIITQMKNLLIRDIEENVIDSWKQEAKRLGVSMQELLKKTINDNAPKAKMTKEDILAKIDELRAQSGPQKSNIALEVIREGRDYLDNKIESLRN